MLLLVLALSISACAVVPHKLNNDQRDEDRYFVRRVEALTATKHRSWDLSAVAVTAGDFQSFGAKRFSRGDLVKLSIPSMKDYNGIYQINSVGSLELPFNENVLATGLTAQQLTKKVKRLLVDKGWFREPDFILNISLVQESAIEVSVYGAVFNPGRVIINETPVDKPQEPVLQETGAFSSERDLTAAIRAAGGLRPDAKASHIMIKRDSKVHRFDLTSVVDGQLLPFIPHLINGDQVFVVSNGVENTNLIRPSQLTPPGMRVLMSNLTAPTLSNALSAVGADSTRLPYGSSLLDAAVSANCVGGTHQANASRTILLITRHYGSKQQIVLKRTINELLATSSDSLMNPFLMPNDGIACYDSRFTNIRDIARGVGELFGPIILGGIL